MNESEELGWRALKRCSFLPGSFDKRWVKNADPEKAMTKEGRTFMLKLLMKYRRQIPGWNELINNILKEVKKNEG